MALEPCYEETISSLLTQTLKLDRDYHEELLYCLNDVRKYLDRQENTCTRGEDATADEADDSVKQACLLFAARALRGCRSRLKDIHLRNQGLQLSKIVSATRTNIFDLFRELPITLEKVSPLIIEAPDGTDKLQDIRCYLRDWQKTLVATSLLARKYKELLARLITPKDTTAVAQRVGWLLYLVVKSRVLQKFPDLVSCVELLVCTMHLVAVDDAEGADDAPETLSSRRARQLKELTDIVHADWARVQLLNSAVVSVGGPLLQRCCLERKLCDSQRSDQGSKQRCILPAIANDAMRGQKCLDALNLEYEAYYSTDGEIDERELLDQEPPKPSSPRYLPENVQALARRSPVLMQGCSPRGPNASFQSPVNSSVPILVRRPPKGPGFVSPTYGSSPCAAFTSPVPNGTPTGTSPHSSILQGQAAKVLMMHSPLPTANLAGVAHKTPISEAMMSSAWVKQITSNSANEPGVLAKKYLELCKGGENAILAITQRLKEMTEKVLPDPPPMISLSALPSANFSVRRQEVMKVYWHVLEAILTEEEKLGAQPEAIVGKLSSTKFHTGLVACCFEVLVASYRMVTLAFPTVLERIGMPAFEFANVVHLFVRYEPNLPRELKRHLFLIEEKILECMAWQPRSPLLDYLRTCNIAAKLSEPGTREPHEELNQASHGPPPSPKRGLTSSVEPFVSPLKRARSIVVGPSRFGVGVMGAAPPPGFACPDLNQSAGNPESSLAQLPVNAVDGTQMRLDAVPDPKVALALRDFLRRVLKLAYHRLLALCEHFSFGPLDKASVVSAVYHVFKSALYERTPLFFNRHLDQVLLSSLYGYCKAQKLHHVSFREIINFYRSQPHSSQEVFRSVVLEQDETTMQVHKRGDIIAFYNVVFVPMMKPFLVERPAISNNPTTVNPASGPTPPTLSSFPGPGNCNQNNPSGAPTTNAGDVVSCSGGGPHGNGVHYSGGNIGHSQLQSATPTETGQQFTAIGAGVGGLASTVGATPAVTHQVIGDVPMAGPGSGQRRAGGPGSAAMSLMQLQGGSMNHFPTGLAALLRAATNAAPSQQLRPPTGMSQQTTANGGRAVQVLKGTTTVMSVPKATDGQCQMTDNAQTMECSKAVNKGDVSTGSWGSEDSQSHGNEEGDEVSGGTGRT